MCTKTPKAPKAPTDKKPQYLRNPLLDGLAIGASSGRNSLRIDLTGSGASRPFAPPITGYAPDVRIPTPVGRNAMSGLAIQRTQPARYAEN